MARLTIEDCLKHVNNRFELVLKAAKRARELERGAEPLVEWENDKPTVVALREIAEGIDEAKEKDEDNIEDIFVENNENNESNEEQEV